jgi:penicillin-binding protein 2
MSNPGHWQAIHQAMIDVVHGAAGTARRIGAGISYRIAGKTGTAQLIGVPQDRTYDPDSIPERYRDHALFIAFAPVDAPRIALAILVENGGSGSASAAPIARQLFDRYLQRVQRLSQG